ncbi:WUSCHEL- homeobox [Ancistrocladus abbreviatus]
MEDQAAQDPSINTNPSSSRSNGKSQGSDTADQQTEPVRSRWTPKPEQILILESIFNSGMVNPPKDETVRIRKLLEKFGRVGDANVFYWFQNRRSKSRRRQRQLQAVSLAAPPPQTTTVSTAAATYISGAPLHHTAESCTGLTDSGKINQGSPPCVLDPCGGSFTGASSWLCSSSSSGNDSFFRQMSLPEMEHVSNVCPSDASNLDYQSPGSQTAQIERRKLHQPDRVWDLPSSLASYKRNVKPKRQIDSQSEST